MHGPNLGRAGCSVHGFVSFPVVERPFLSSRISPILPKARAMPSGRNTISAPTYVMANTPHKISCMWHILIEGSIHIRPLEVATEVMSSRGRGRSMHVLLPSDENELVVRADDGAGSKRSF